MTPPEITALAELCDVAEADYADDWNAAIEAGERPDLWEPPEVEVPVPTLRALLAEREAMRERLQAVIDWADYALSNPQEFDSHGVRNLDGPVFDEARATLSAITPPAPAPKEPEHG